MGSYYTFEFGLTNQDVGKLLDKKEHDFKWAADLLTGLYTQYDSMQENQKKLTREAFEKGTWKDKADDFDIDFEKVHSWITSGARRSGSESQMKTSQH